MTVKKLFGYSFIFFLFASCTKIDTTTVGNDLIPPVDGVNTFATDTFSIETENGIFNDTSKVFKSDDHIIGNLQNTPNFGATNAGIYLQYSPNTKFRWLAYKDSISVVNAGSTVNGYDSSFICLGLVSRSLGNAFYGDTTKDLTFEVYRITTASNFVKDSAYRINQAPGGVADDAVLIGTRTIKPQDLKNYNVTKIKGFTDSTNDQIRIKLNGVGDSWVRNNVLLQDTVNFNTRAGFTSFMNGFVIKVKQDGVANSLVRVSLASNATRMEVYYKYRNVTVDTARQYFYFNPSYNSDWGTANANYINRNIAGSNMQTAATPGNDNTLYLESTPGSFVKVKVPHIKSFPNKMIHRAELIVQEVGNQDNIFYSPTQIFMDCFDTTNTLPQRNVTVPFDYYINNNTGSPDLNYFGGDRRNRTNTVIGGLHTNYIFNVTKYFQNMITRNLTKYDFRLYVPFDTRYYSQALGYNSNFAANFSNVIWPLINTPAFGRVVVGGGNHPQYKMKLRVIYSNL
jgi:hypothetical protein